MSTILRLGIIGAQGRLGKAISLLASKENLKVETLTKENASRFLELVKDLDVIIDVSLPVASEIYLNQLSDAKLKIPYVIGCTGWQPIQFEKVKKYSASACVVFAPNFSPAIQLLLKILEDLSPALKDLGYSATIKETHHVHKKDAPSGTAKTLAAALERTYKDIEIESVREGEVIGVHEIFFKGQEDQIVLTHQAFDRKLFARGALLAARWASQKKASGLFSMKEVLFQK